MLNEHIASQIYANFAFAPTLGQKKIIEALASWLSDADPERIFILNGYAGTGKTSIIAAFVATLKKLRIKPVMLAPTGRAAKVFSGYAGQKAFTIHKKIYRQKVFSNETDNFVANQNLHRNTLFIVDEASMIANEGLSGGHFGSGRLLDDLVQYVYNGLGCRLMLIGDTAQLPPIGEEESPALSVAALQGYGLEVTECVLTKVVRQTEGSGILSNATALRERIVNEDFFEYPKISCKNYPDIRILPGSELIEAIDECYGHVGLDETIVICRSNKRASLYNKGIRNTVLYREDELNTGDMLMVAKNNYFWGADCKELDFIANGDVAVVRRVRRVREMYGFRFADVVLAFPDYDGIELEVKILLDTLHSELPSLSKEENDRLFYAVLEDYADLPTKRERMKKMKEDPYYNALQVKYAYAVTCHKAQGGQWKRVFLDQGYMTEDMLSPDYFRWLYTAFTRATDLLYLVNWPEEQTEK